MLWCRAIFSLTLQFSCERENLACKKGEHVVESPLAHVVGRLCGLLRWLLTGGGFW
jgi:hypothetical protein